MSAEEMFKQLGYACTFSDTEIIYRKKNSKHTSNYIFDVLSKNIIVSRYDEHNHMAKTITFEQIQAIYKQLQELGWIEEEEE